MQSSLALLLTTSLPFAGSAAAKDLWPKTPFSPVRLGEDRSPLPVSEPTTEITPPALLVQGAAAAQAYPAV